MSEGLLGARGKGVQVTMIKSGGGVFDIESLDAATGWADFVGLSSIDLVGTLSDGGVVNQTVAVNSTWISFTLNGFVNLTQLVFTSSEGVSLDDFNNEIRTADVPEPSTLAIFALGMIGLVSRRYREHS